MPRAKAAEGAGTSFSKDAYRSLITGAQREGYTFRGFLDDRGETDRCILLRHDVDYSLRMAVELAEINRSLGVAGTFCILLRSHIYNPLSAWSIDEVRKLRDCGQHVALHYAAPARLPASDAELVKLILSDFEVLRGSVPDLLPAFAWHNPTAELIERGQRLEVPGLVNLYGARFVTDMAYVTDSNMRHSVAEFATLMASGRHARFHLLFHPLIWVAGGRTMLDVFARAWTYIIREREEEMRLNRSYRAVFPDGMPDTLLETFASRWADAVAGALEDRPCIKNRPEDSP